MICWERESNNKQKQFKYLFIVFINRSEIAGKRKKDIALKFWLGHLEGCSVEEKYFNEAALSVLREIYNNSVFLN